MSALILRPIGLDELPPEVEGANLFARRFLLEVQEDTLEVTGVYDEGGVMAAYFGCLVRRKGPFVLRTPPRFSPYAPIWIRSYGSNKSSEAGRRKRVLDAIAVSLLDRGGVISLAFPPTLVDMQCFAWRGFKVVPRYTYRIDLRRGLDATRGDMSPKRRNDLSKALRYGIEIEASEDIGKILSQVGRTLERKGRPFELDLAERIMAAALGAGKGFGRVAYEGGKPVAVAFCAHDEGTAYYLFGGHDPEARSHGAGAAVLWECVRESSSRGMSIFDFEGSMIPEVEAFFRDFGGDLVPYFVVNRAPILLEIGLKALRRSQF